jgi:hypothetical protein
VSEHLATLPLVKPSFQASDTRDPLATFENIRKVRTPYGPGIIESYRSDGIYRVLLSFGTGFLHRDNICMDPAAEPAIRAHFDGHGPHFKSSDPGYFGNRWIDTADKRERIAALTW